MVNIFEYTDCRKYLRDVYAQKKQEDPHFSYQVFATMGGFKDKSCIHSVVCGRRDLSSSAALKFAKALRLSKTEFEYFSSLISFTQASSHEEKDFFFNKLSEVKGRGPGHSSKARVVRHEQYEIYSKWYYSAIRAIISAEENFKGNFNALSKKVYPTITPLQAKKSVQLLEKLGFIKRNPSGAYIVTEKKISTGNEVLDKVAIANFHIGCADLAKNAINMISNLERDVTGMTVGISKDGFEEIRNEIQQTRARISEIAARDDSADRVYQINFHFFPMSEPLSPSRAAE